MKLYSFFTKNGKNGKSADQEGVNAQLGLTSEEELGSFEDKVYTTTYFFAVFGWFFYYNFFAILKEHPEYYLYL
jgi:hypothetical protein